MADGQTTTVATGQVLTSIRQLEDQAGYRTRRLVLGDLRELRSANAIDVSAIRRFPRSTASGSETTPLPRGRIVTGKSVLGTLITVHGVRHLREEGGDEKATKREETYGLTPVEEAENTRALRTLEAEGR